ncbi:hypothetical protein CYMTET_41435 [Cymbomonas tetramitiformis]|uniref:RING-type domain-containing protein n=1 Tax=Cymbomonas tetramitiformis TaxID=36881 RepID=A0AAE0F2N9_9CHLO|nr:hypothetical protein CYMTET_41435 [Cymbomonas tetramitiformis]
MEIDDVHAAQTKLGGTTSITCPICNDTIYQAQILSCGHSYCAVCIYKWLLSPMAKNSPSCPVCRQKLACMPTLNVSLQSALEDIIMEKARKNPRTDDSLSSMRKAVEIRHAKTFADVSEKSAQFWRTRFLACATAPHREQTTHRATGETARQRVETPSVQPNGVQQPESTQNMAVFATLNPRRPVPQVANMECVHYMNKLRLRYIRAQMEETRKPSHRIGFLWSEMQNPVRCNHCQKNILAKREYFVAHHNLPQREDSEPRASHLHCFKTNERATLAEMSAPTCMDFFTLDSKQMAYVRKQIQCARRGLNTRTDTDVADAPSEQRNL